jgi:hypothetical protein
MNPHRKRHLVLALVAANLLLAGYVVYRQSLPEAAAEAVPLEKTQSLPGVSLRDDGGRVFDSKQLLGQFLFVQFINPHVKAQIDSLTEVLTDRPKRPVSWLVMTEDATALRSRLGGLQDGVVVVESNYWELRKLFGVPACCEMRFLFDQRGKLVNRGYYFQDGMPNRMRSFVDGEQGYSPALLLDSMRSVRGGQFERVQAAAMRSQSGKALILLLTSANTTCPSGDLARRVSEFSREHGEVEFLALLPDTFSRSDVENFKTNLDIPFPVETADADFSRRWASLIEEYGEMSVNGAVITINREKVSVGHTAKEVERQLKEL